MAVRFTTKLVSKWTPEKIKNLNILLLDTATKIHRDAGKNAPVDKGSLKKSGRIENIKNGYSIAFGGGSVRYAKRRHYENRKNPQTLHYLERAGDNNTKNLIQEIKKL